MEYRRQTAGASVVLFCVVASLLAGDLADAHGGLVQLPAHGTVSAQQLCQDLCGECQCSGQLVGENVCQCNCDFPSASNGGSNCTVKVKRLCRQMDVQCDFNGPEITYVRAPRGGCHTMSCYEKHHGHEEGGHEGYYGADEESGEYEEGYEHGGKELICCKSKKHKEKKHKLKKHHKKEKHTKFHIIIKGKMPEHSCHQHEEGNYGEGDYEGHEGYRAVSPDHHQMKPTVSHQPMEVTVWKNGKKFPLKRPPQGQPPPHLSPPVAPHPAPASRGKSAEPPSQPAPSPPEEERPPQEQSPIRPPEPESPPQEPLTPPPNLYDGAPVPVPQERPLTPKEPPKSPSHPAKVSPPSASFSRPAPPPPPSPPSHWPPAPPPPPPPMITVDPPPRRSFSEPSYSDCQFESYDLNYFHPPSFYSAPPPPPPPPPPPLPPPPTFYSPPPPPPPPPSFYRSYSPPYDPYDESSYYQPREQYQTSKHYSDYEERPRYREHDDTSYDEDEGHHGHNDPGVHPLSDHEVEDWPPPPERDPADLLAFNQIVSRQIWENERAILYSTPPFQPTPRPLRDEFEPPVAEIGAVQYESFGSGEKNYDMEHRPIPPEDAFIPPVPPPASPVEFPTAAHAPAAYPSNSEEAQYRPPTPPPHYVRIKNAGRLPSYGLDRPSSGWGGYRSAGQAGSQWWPGTSQHGRMPSSSGRF